jgi:hypothetical protein
LEEKIMKVITIYEKLLQISLGWNESYPVFMKYKELLALQVVRNEQVGLKRRVQKHL